jgi:hypothetical protein
VEAALAGNIGQVADPAHQRGGSCGPAARRRCRYDWRCWYCQLLTTAVSLVAPVRTEPCGSGSHLEKGADMAAWSLTRDRSAVDGGIVDER